MYKIYFITEYRKKNFNFRAQNVTSFILGKLLKPCVKELNNIHVTLDLTMKAVAY